jgi:PAS domain S-box-containing protein
VHVSDDQLSSQAATPGPPAHDEEGGLSAEAMRAFGEAIRTFDGAIRTFAERASVGVFLAHGVRLLYANPHLCEMIGYPREALLAMEDSVGTLIVPQEQARIQAYGEGRMRGEAVPSLYETRLVRADGTLLPVEFAVSAVEVDGAVISQGIVHDVSERARMQAALREQEAALHALLDASTESAALLDPQGRILAANAALARALGRPLEELAGRAVWPFFPKEICASRKAALEEVVRTGQAVRFVDTRQGRTFDAQICPVLDGAGEVTSVAVFARDITEQRAAEQASEDAHQALLRRNRDLIALNRVATTLARSLDLEAALGVVPEQVIDRQGIDAAALVLPQGIRGAPLLLARGADAGAPLLADLLGGLSDEPCFLGYVGAARAELAATGRAILFHEPEEMPPPLSAALERAGFGHMACMPVPMGVGTSGALVLLARERLHVSEGTLHTLSAIVAQVGWAVENGRLGALTSEIQVREEVSALRARFFADVSHEFRTPLGLIRSASQSLLSPEVRFEPEVRDELLRIVEEETGRLDELVEDLLLVARGRERALELHCCPVDLVGLARAAAQRTAVARQAAAPGTAPSHQLQVVAAEEPIVVWVDPSALGHVFSNLLTNAVKYTPHGGAITVEVAQQDDEAVVRVRDEGIGIAPEHIEYLFERFYRVPNEATAQQGGVGLGLPVCKALVEAHGGRIWVESRVGEGSVFGFTVPLAGERDA